VRSEVYIMRIDFINGLISEATPLEAQMCGIRIPLPDEGRGLWRINNLWLRFLYDPLGALGAYDIIHPEDVLIGPASVVWIKGKECSSKSTEMFRVAGYGVDFHDWLKHLRDLLGDGT